MRRRSSAAPLAAAYLMLLVYASLYPFTGWRWPPGREFIELLALPAQPWRNGFDEWSNLAGYAPLGALLLIARLRAGHRPMAALALALLLPAGLSFGLEVAQQFLPGRVPSLRDLVLNALGAGLGALLASLCWSVGLFDRWEVWRDRWFAPPSAGAVALLLLWPVGLLIPSPVPLGLGQLFDVLRGALGGALQGVPWATSVAALLEPAAASQVPLSPLREGLIIALGLLSPCLLAFAAMRPGWRRLVMTLTLVLLALVTTTLSTALNFGPAHALTWLAPTVLPAFLGGALAACGLSLAGARRVAALGLVTLTALVVLVAQAPADPYYAASLQGWEQGRFIRFHGVAQWVGWLWPYAAMLWLLGRLSQRT